MFKLSLTPKPEPTYEFAPGMAFIKDAKQGSERVIILHEKLNTWQDNRWEDIEGASWTEGYLKSQFKSGDYKYVGQIHFK